MCIRDSVLTGLPNRLLLTQRVDFALRMAERNGGQFAVFFLCLLYTSDAADERSSVDLGGRRILKKKLHG